MNIYALYHKPNSNYCFTTLKNNITVRLRVAKNEKAVFSVIYGCKYRFGDENNEKALKKLCTDGIFDWYQARFVIDDPRLMYIFKIEENGKALYYHEEGLTNSYDFSQCYLNAFQLPYAWKSHDEVEWLKNAVFYQIFVERFYKGIQDKDTGYINMKWGDAPQAKSFAGGDLPGITQNLEYIKSLGINALYLTPVFTSPTNHKYDTWDYTTVDPAFGTNDDLKELVQKAHGLGMRICLDAVFNHCGEGFFAWLDIKKNGVNSKYYSWFCFDENGYESFYGCSYMPKLNTENEQCAEYFLNIAEKWIKDFDIDALRLDVSDEISFGFWRKFRQTVKRAKPDCAIIGENWHDAEPFLRGDQFDGIMNYAVTRALRQYFASSELDEKGLADRLCALMMRNTDTANSQMLNLLDSHDTHRFLTLCDGDVEAMQAALAVTYFLPGAICIYYGTENNMEGGYDPDCRRCFIPSETESETSKLIKRLSSIKPKLLSDIEIYESNGTFIIKRDGMTLKIKDKRILEVT